MRSSAAVNQIYRHNSGCSAASYCACHGASGAAAHSLLSNQPFIGGHVLPCPPPVRVSSPTRGDLCRPAKRDLGLARWGSTWRDLDWGVSLAVGRYGGCPTPPQGQHRLRIGPIGWEWQSPVTIWKNIGVHLGQHNAVRTFASKYNKRKGRSFQNKSTDPTLDSEEASSGIGGSARTSLKVDSKDVAAGDKILGAPRSNVLQACTFTSGFLLAGGIVLRQASHLAHLEGWPTSDPTEVSFNFETWHLELVAVLVIFVSSSRYILLQTWSDFRDSSEAANRQILTSLEPLDYIFIACFSGISEELLFRGALMPIVGLNWISVLIVGALFGVLHLGNGRRYSFAIWATFVGVAYGIGAITSSSIIVPMASHSINNIIGALLWRFTNNSEKEM